MGQRMQPKPSSDTLSPVLGFSRSTICSGPCSFTVMPDADRASFGAQAAAKAAAPLILMKSLLFIAYTC